uniref:Si:dkey-30c15.13 n=1 Tax=Poecilia latipinna TaxID=48699 RepID=A0A3B3VQD6_9TELE
MMQNMFQEGLYHVFFKETPPASPPTETSNTNNEELTNVRIHRWFGTVVNTRLLVTGVIQVLSALASVLATVSHACVSYGCSVVMVTPVWSSLSYAAAGCLAVEVQRKASNVKIIILMALNVFSLLFGFAVQSAELLLIGLRRYSSRNVKAYIRISQVQMSPEPKVMVHLDPLVSNL